MGPNADPTSVTSLPLLSRIAWPLGAFPNECARGVRVYLRKRTRRQAVDEFLETMTRGLLICQTWRFPIGGTPAQAFPPPAICRHGQKPAARRAGLFDRP